MRGALAAGLVVLAASAAQAELFDGLFGFAETEPEPGLDGPVLSGSHPDAGLCVAAIRQAEKAHGIPADLLLAIGLQEAGLGLQGSTTVWPWSLNVDGEGFRFDTREEAEDFLARELDAGAQSIDVGCLQVNLRWHPGAFPSPAAGFDPERNADYAARFLRGLHDETGDWLEAAGRYHSATDGLKDAYLAGVERNLSRLEDSAWEVDALADGAGLALGTAVAEKRKMNPLRAPVRTGQGGAGGGVYRRTLMSLPAEDDGPAPDDETLP
ncbi:lytic transglycosylase domain-containing protein [Tabrizicola sp.]|uniref:lytic transglycosylase domain-containing protein n=1 Tax=Tabrizicola sp. TaxID=2005166 RepID=UPI0035B2B81F